MVILFGLILIFSGPRFGEALQCYWAAYQAFGGGWSSIICESPLWVELKFTAVFQVTGALFCMLGLWLMKAPQETETDT